MARITVAKYNRMYIFSSYKSSFLALIIILTNEKFTREDKMQEKWTYRNYEIEEGLKPGSKTFRYFFKVLENGEKKCNYCVWIADNAIEKFDPSQEFDAVVSSQKTVWHEWVKKKIDEKDFRNRALKIEKQGQHEINLSEMSEHIRPD